MIELVANILASAAMSLAEEQPTLSKFTSETNEYEPNLSFHYANTLRRFLFWLDCDFDVIKPNFENKRPDIIFHKRGIHSLNFLVVEVKRSERDAEEDIEKINDNWFKEPLSYRFGASVVLRENGSFCVQLLESSAGEEKTRRSNEDFKKLVISVAADQRAALTKLSDRIREVQQELEANTTELEGELDRLVYALYARTREKIKPVEGGNENR